VQHLSAACRAARFSDLRDTVAARILRHLDDVDVEKCREERTSFAGPIVFFVIALTISIILLNGPVGEKVVENMITSFVSSFLIANAYLFEYSTFIFLIVYVIIGGIAVYVYFIFGAARRTVLRHELRDHPTNAAATTGEASGTAVRLSHARQRKHLRGWRLVREIVSQIWLFIATELVFLSPEQVREYRRRHKRPIQELWRNMNTPTDLQGALATKAFLAAVARRRSSANRHMVAATSHTLPPAILAMRPRLVAEMSHAHKRSSLSRTIDRKLFGIEAFDHKCPLHIRSADSSKPVIYLAEPPVEVAEDAAVVQANPTPYSVELTEDATVALDLLLCELKNATPDGTNKESAALSDLFDQFQNIWSTLTPVGHELSKAQQDKVTEMFLEWTEGAYVGNERVLLGLFEKWFLEELYPRVLEMVGPPNRSNRRMSGAVRRTRLAANHEVVEEGWVQRTGSKGGMEDDDVGWDQRVRRLTVRNSFNSVYENNKGDCNSDADTDDCVNGGGRSGSVGGIVSAYENENSYFDVRRRPLSGKLSLQELARPPPARSSLVIHASSTTAASLKAPLQSPANATIAQYSPSLSLSVPLLLSESKLTPAAFITPRRRSLQHSEVLKQLSQSDSKDDEEEEDDEEEGGGRYRRSL
jgi:hypothetical protein